MSMKIENLAEKIANQELTWKEANYLKGRSQLPKGYPMPEGPTQGKAQEVEPPPTRVTPLAEQSIPKIENAGGIVDGWEEDYLEGWNNEKRRAELSKRGLSVDGNKDTMIGRLRRSDSQELEDTDYLEIS